MTNTGGFGTFGWKVGKTGESDMPVKRKTSAPVEVVRDTEFVAMLEALGGYQQMEVRGRLILALMYYAGLRRSEVCNLRMSDANLAANDPRLEVRKSKFDKGRNVPIDPRLMPHIHRWLARRQVDSEYLVCTYANVRPNAICASPNPPGSQVQVNTVWNTVKTAARRAGITRRIRPHMFRHAAATNWMQSGLSAREVQYLLGHEHLHTTQKYLHVHDAEIAKKVYALGNQTSEQHAPTPAASTLAAFRDCPWCAEPIRMAAIVCRYCGRDVALAAS